MIRSTCPYCGVGCGVILTPSAGGHPGALPRTPGYLGDNDTQVWTVRGDPDHPANRGRLCSKGSALAETLGHDGRLLTPVIDGQAAGWDAALDIAAGTFRQTIADHGPDSVAFYLSGQLLTEDYYVANKLMKGFIGSANVDTNSRLCMASTVAGHVRAFGSDTVPGNYDDLDQADLVVLVGSNLAWCHPVLWQRVEAARATRDTKVVVIDPRRTVTADAADLHLPLSPGTDVALFNRLLVALANRGCLSGRYLAQVDGLDATLAAARADRSEIGATDALLARFIDLWCATERVVTVYSQGVNQSTTGTDKVNAILNCHLATGRIGRPGMGPFSVTGQPNAMGGREVGGLANQLACHLRLEDAGHRAAVGQFWGSERIPDRPGLKAVDMFDAVADGRVRALWIIHTNPAVTMPDADRVRAAIAACPFTVVSEVTAATDTARAARILLPAAAWAEKSGTVTNSDRTISRQRAVLAPPGQARPDWWALAQVAQRMGFAGFDWAGPAAIFREHAALSGIAGRLGRDFDISARMGLSDAAYDAMAPFRWPQGPGGRRDRFFADGAFFTPDGRGRMVPVTARPLAAALTPARPFRLNTGRIRDQWHTMTRTARSPRLNGHLGEPFVEVHPDDAARCGLSAHAMAQVQGDLGHAILRVVVTDRVRPGQIFAPMHWTGETAPSGRIDALVPGAVDPVSGQPELKGAAVALASWPARWFGFAASAGPMALQTAYWARRATQTGWAAELAALDPPQDAEDLARHLFGLPQADVLRLDDPARGLVTLALVAAGRIAALLYGGPTPVALSRDVAIARIGQPAGADTLAPRAGAGQPDPGPILCACMGVGRNVIGAAIAGGARTVAAIGAVTGAGTNCGACRPELQAIIGAAPRAFAAE